MICPHATHRARGRLQTAVPVSNRRSGLTKGTVAWQYPWRGFYAPFGTRRPCLPGLRRD